MSRVRPPGRKSINFSALTIAIPTLLIFGIFSWWPIISGGMMSFQRTNFVGPAEWVGWDNFLYVLSDPRLSIAIGNTLLFTFLAVLFGFPLPLTIAVVISTVRQKLQGAYAILAYLPVIVPPVVAILLWKFFYQPTAQGLFNTVLASLGIEPLPWLSDASLAMPAIVLQATWAGAGTSILIYLATLTTVRPDLYEAAMLDGANIRQRLWHVTLPQMRGIILIMMLLQLIGATQVFTEPFLMTDGGPQNATLTILLLMYKYAFGGSADYGAATALSVMLALVLASLSGLYLWLTRKWSSV